MGKSLKELKAIHAAAERVYKKLDVLRDRAYVRMEKAEQAQSAHPDSPAPVQNSC